MDQHRWLGRDRVSGFPANDIVRDSNGDLYVSNDWGVLRRANGSSIG